MASPTRAAGEKQLEVRIITPERIAFQEKVDAVVATAFDGEVGILPGHAPMMGFLHVADDVVTVLTPFAESAREVDVDEARRLEITTAENPLLQGSILGEEQRKRLAKLRERVAAKAR